VGCWRLDSGLLETGQWTAGNLAVGCWRLDSGLLETGVACGRNWWLYPALLLPQADLLSLTLSCEVEENCALLGCFAMSGLNSLQIFRDSLLGFVTLQYGIDSFYRSTSGAVWLRSVVFNGEWWEKFANLRKGRCWENIWSDMCSRIVEEQNRWRSEAIVWRIGHSNRNKIREDWDGWEMWRERTRKGRYRGYIRTLQKEVGVQEDQG